MYRFGLPLIGTVIISLILTSSSILAANPPEKPTDLLADDVFPTQINLSWTGPQDDGGSPIAGYKIEFKKIPNSYQVLTADTQSTATTFNHTNLETGKTYIYRVYAINAEGESESSSEAVATPSPSSTPPENIVPNPPTQLEAHDVSSTRIDIAWIKPATNNGPPVTGYKIEVKSGSDSFATLVNKTTDTLYSHKNATTGISYTYRVFAINSIGNSNPSNIATATPTQSSEPPQQSMPPNSPSNLVVSHASPTELSLSWDPPVANNGPPVTGYKIEYKVGSGDYTTLVANNGPKTTYKHTNLNSETTYTYRVFAINSVGLSNQSNEDSAKPQHTLTPQLVAKAVSSKQVDLSWIPPSQTFGMPIRGYVVQEKISTGIYQTIEEIGGSETKFSVSNLQTDKTYTFVVYAKYSLGASDVSNEASATPTKSSIGEDEKTIPSPPVGLAAFAKSINQIELFWDPPVNNGGLPITGYNVEVKISSGKFVTLAQNVATDTRSYTHSNLSPNTSYTYRVFAINSIGTSGASNEASATTDPPKVINTPTSPTGVTAKLITSSQVTLSWKAPTNDGGSQITGYKVEFKEDSGEFVILSANTGKITSYSQSGLKEGRTYSYRVYAINSAGTSSPSDVVSVSTQSSTQDPKDKIPGFPDPSKDPQYYIDRYNNEPEYKAWFDSNFPDLSIYEVLGIPEPEPSLPEPTGLCGPGTELINETCTVVENKEGGGCLIATAAFGTELSDEVQLLREFRQNKVVHTATGLMFLENFNKFYYSFSPAIADYERQNPAFREFVKISITPLLLSLSIFNHVDIDSEYDLLALGVGIISLNFGMYIVVPAFTIPKICSTFKKSNKF